MNNKTWSLVPFTSAMNVVGNKQVFKAKYNSDGRVHRYEVSLVTKGFQKSSGIDYFETFSPVAKPFIIKVILSLAIGRGWDNQQIDINNVFLKVELQ